MRFAERVRPALAALLAAAAVSGCGGGNSTQTTLSGECANSTTASVTEPSGDNTTQITVDAGPTGGFSLGVVNLPYVSVTVCEAAPSTKCVTVDHVMLDTGSIGLRLLRSTVQSLALPLETVASGTLLECYPFVIGAVWGPVAQADVHLGGESAAAVPIQLIDDLTPPIATAPADCLSIGTGGLMQSVSALQAKGILGVGILRYDCGLNCQMGKFGSNSVPYYGCDAQGNCTLSAVAPEQQVQNPVPFFPVNNNGTIVVMPSVTTCGATLAQGRLVLGIGTQSNNQIASSAQIYSLDTDPTHAQSYLAFSTTIGSTLYDNAYVDSGSNGFFFNDSSLSTACVGTPSGGEGWYCPRSATTLTARIDSAAVGGVAGNSVQLDFTIASADALFATANFAFADLGGTAGAANPGAFVWGMPFFYGRSVYTSIWGQSLAVNGPWYAF